MKVLITGGAGFIGSHLAEEYLNAGHEVYVIDNLSTGSIENIKHLDTNEKFHYKIDTILDYMLMRDIIEHVDVVFHLAAAVGVKYIIENPLLSIETNVKGTEIVLDLANRFKKKVIITSTSEVYGKNTKMPLKEVDDRVQGATSISRWSYACTKALDEFLALAYYREKKFPVIVIRLFNVCGPRQSGAYGMVIPRFVKAALMGNDITVYGDGKQSRCFSYVKDIVKVFMALEKEEKAIGEVINVGSDNEITILDLASKVKEMTNSESEIVFIPYEKAYESNFEDMLRRYPDLTKLESLIGFKPDTPLDVILEKVIEYFRM